MYVLKNHLKFVKKKYEVVKLNLEFLLYKLHKNNQLVIIFKLILEAKNNVF